jgi:hypothetical protein
MRKARGKKRHAHTVLVKKPVENRPLGTPTKEKISIKVALKETGEKNVDWNYLAQNIVKW